MKKLFLLFALTPLLSYAQIAQDNVMLSANTPLIFSYTSVDELQVPKIIQNALELKLAPKNYSRNIMASVNFVGLSQNQIPADWLSLRLVNKSSINAIVYKNQISISPTPILLFTQPPTPANQDLIFDYDLILNPLHSFITTGTFTFNIIISISQS